MTAGRLYLHRLKLLGSNLGFIVCALLAAWAFILWLFSDSKPPMAAKNPLPSAPTYSATQSAAQQQTVSNGQGASTGQVVIARPPTVPAATKHQQTVAAFADPRAELELPELPEIIR